MAEKRKTISFSTYFIGTFIALPTLAIAIIISIIGYQMDRVLTKQTGESVQAIAASDGHRFSGELLAKIDLLRTLSRDYASYRSTIEQRDSQTARLSNAETKALLTDKDKQWQNEGSASRVRSEVLNNEASQHLGVFARKFPGFKQVMLLDRDGGVIASGNTAVANIYLADQGWWQRATGSTYDVNIESPQLSSDKKEATIQFIIPVAAPTISVPRAYLYAEYQLNELSIFADSSQANSVGGAITLLDASDQVLVDTDGIVAGSTMTHDNTLATWKSGDIAGKSMIYSRATINQIEDLKTNAISWSLMVRKDKSKTLGYIGDLIWLLLLAGVVVLILVIVVSYRLARGFIVPIRQLTQTAKSLHDGDYRQRAPGSRFAELNTLAETFNIMTDTLVRSQADLMASIRGLSQGFIMADKTGQILNINQSALNLLGFKAKTRPHTISQALSVLGDTKIIEQFNSFINNAGIADTGSYTLKDIEHKGSFYNIYFSPIVIDETVLGAVVQIIDETEQKILQRSRDEFFSIASHELRTPLTAIRGNSDMIKTFFDEKVKSKDFSQMIDDIHSSSVRLIEIVSDFLDASRLEQGKIALRPAPFDIKSVIETIIYENNIVANAKGIHLILHQKTLGDLPRVFADRDRVKQIIYNLVGNAIKYTHEGSVTLEIKTRGDDLWLYVIDTGEGISSKNQKLLFHKFQQAKESLYTRDTSRGTGLGLYISRLLADKMNGAIGLKQSREGHGSTFYLRLPLAKKGE